MVQACCIRHFNGSCIHIERYLTPSAVHEAEYKESNTTKHSTNCELKLWQCKVLQRMKGLAYASNTFSSSQFFLCQFLTFPEYTVSGSCVLSSHSSSLLWSLFSSSAWKLLSHEVPPPPPFFPTCKEQAFFIFIKFGVWHLIGYSSFRQELIRGWSWSVNAFG